MGIVKIIFGSMVAVGLLIGGLLLTKITPEKKDQQPLFEKGEQRRSITFLLGTDKPGYQYFKLAEDHFLFSEKEKTDVLVKTCRSLEDLIVYLNNCQEPQPWKSIQVVLHGNPYSGLSIPITSKEGRATPKNLVKAMMNNPLPALNTDAVDSSTMINFWACGIGKNPFINIALNQFLTLPDGTQPKVYTSPHFVIFKEDENSGVPKRLNASYWPYFYKRGYRPGDAEIAQALATQFPEVSMDWQEAIGQEAPGDSAAAFQNSFHIPVSWTLIYPTKESRPALNTKQEKLEWVRAQEELMEQVQAYNIPLDRFEWTVNKIRHTDENGNVVPAVKGIGMATVLCVLESKLPLAQLTSPQ